MNASFGSSRTAAGNERSRIAARARVAVGVAGPLTVAAALPTPGRLLADARTASMPDEVVGAVALLAASVVVWLLAVWALVVLGTAAASRMPGGAGRAARTVLGVITPHAVRRVLLLAAGASIVAATSACGTSTGSPEPTVSASVHPVAAAAVLPVGAAADGAADGAAAGPHPGMGASGAALLDLDWPRLDSGRVGEHPVRPIRAAGAQDSRHQDPRHQDSRPAAPPDSRHQESAASPESASHHPVPGDDPRTTHGNTGPDTGRPIVVTVQPGDSLWTIAAAHLPPGTSASDIDTAWRTWYSANRDVIGEDPGLIFPGQHLVAPAASAPPTRGASREPASTGALTDPPASKGALE